MIVNNAGWCFSDCGGSGGIQPPVSTDNERLITVELTAAKTRCSRQPLAEALPASVQFYGELRQCKLTESEHHRYERPKDNGRRPQVDSLQASDGSKGGN